MKTGRWRRAVVVFSIATIASLSPASEVILTNDTIIALNDTNYEGRAVVISNCTVAVDGPHVFESVRVEAGGILTHSFAAIGVIEGQPTGLNLTVARDVLVEAGGTINVNGKGYGPGQGPGRGASSTGYPAGSGAGHGGNGGLSSSNAVGGPTYGSLEQPADKGSGGGAGGGGSGGLGGGAIRLAMGGALVVNGTISTDGGNATNSRSGGGSGGSIWVTAQSFGGSGTLSAHGGAGEPSHGGGGAGGRVAIECDTNTFAGRITAYGGLGAQAGGAGTIYTSVAGQNKALLVDNGGSAGAASLIQTTNIVDLIISGGAAVTPIAHLNMGTLLIRSNSAIVMPGYPTGALILTVTNDATIESAGGILADGKGYPAMQGVGSGSYHPLQPGGGSHGGNGGGNVSSSGRTYGYIQNPIDPGSGGGNVSSIYLGGAGGGAVRLRVTGTLLVEGKISADGLGGRNSSGGGSGGSVWLTVGVFAGTGAISAIGGAGNGTAGGGGGGRIAVDFGTNGFTGTLRAFGGGGGSRGGAGTIYLKPTSQRGLLVVDNGGHMGTNTPLFSASSALLLEHLTVKGGALAELPSFVPVSLGSLLIDSNAWLLTSSSVSAPSPVTVDGTAIIKSGGGILGDGRRYRGTSGNGAGFYYSASGTNYGGGGGYGGYGGMSGHQNARGGNSYGSPTLPSDPGSDGGSSVYAGGVGGAAIRLIINGGLQLDGRISANGGPPSTRGGGGGSGGSIWLTVGTLEGSGTITANGGNGDQPSGGGGGGGRIAIYYATNLFSGIISAHGGFGAQIGGAGTIYLKPTGQASYLVADNGGRAGTNTPVALTTVHNLVIGGGAYAEFFRIGQSISSLLIKSNGWLTLPGNSPTLFTLDVTGDATIEPGGAIVVDGKGFSTGAGPGGGQGHAGGGGGYGGIGAGNAYDNYGGAYGLIDNPAEAGSGGGHSENYVNGGAGGGAIRLNVSRTLLLDGTISAGGLNGGVASGGGSGGSISLGARTLAGGGSISADGGTGSGRAGGGGGGRIAIYYETNLFSGTVSAYGGGGGLRGGAGTIYTRRISEPTGHVLVDNGGVFGASTPLLSSATLYGVTLRARAVAYLRDWYLTLNYLFIDEGALFTGPPLQTTVDLTVLGNMTIESGATFSAAGKGHFIGGGPGAGLSGGETGSGAGHGGRGGASASASGGAIYGSREQPVLPGSGGGFGFGPVNGGSEGGGAIRLTVAGELMVNGHLSADGNPAVQDNSGGGSGGSIWVMAGTFSGNGRISADGGTGELYQGGGGGGGRIALYSLVNTFMGSTTASGGDGASKGEDGTIFLSTNLPPLEIMWQWPRGTVAEIADHVTLAFNVAFNPETVSASDFALTTPNGEVTNFFLSVWTPTTMEIRFAGQTAIGNYIIRVQPDIEDLFGRPMSQVYTGSFALAPQVVEGLVTDTNGQIVSGVTVQATGGLSSTSDASGRYALGTVRGWSGTVTPSLVGYVFVPRSRSYTNLTTSVRNQDYLMVSSIAPAMTSQLQGTNLLLRWRGIGGVKYQSFWSTNLVDWLPYGGAVMGINGGMEIVAPLGNDPMKFFRLTAEN